MDHQDISSDFPFKSNYVDIHGSKIHYIDEGSGDPIIFLHGNPTSSYLWRNIIPYLSSCGRCIAPDLIGMGKSDKPNIDYRFVDHVKYVEGFIEKKGLRNITFVIHDWGSALGFHYAMHHEKNIKGIAFMEAILKTATWNDFPKDFKLGFRLFRTPVIGWLLIVVMNIFIEQILPKAIVRNLTEKEKNYYREPFKRLKDRKPIRRWPNEIPIDGQPVDVTEIVQYYSRKLQESDLSKLLFFANPGGIITSTVVEWCQQNLKNLKTIDIGKGIHYLQEDNPHLIGSELAKWYKSL
ncbi:haloalkane dehalogenase [bacterium BMS3Abin07]|nr:haloalkane dehalogenase [bacterium BMS3Abin07]GBE32584.1 haloalkane dehalogenase [bacterium BMS3Bbin05]HDO21310.1 haloalkane dehalogenase [Nitrospirota bacterium]HDZ87790.1 haloalkane dehalogenase [Nitrospirota bacterium]